jgi:hypothetical protein
MTEELEPDIRHVWRLRRGSDSNKGPRFTLDAEVHGLFVEPTRDEVRSALMQILDEALGPDPTEIAGWGLGVTGTVEMDLTDEGGAYLESISAAQPWAELEHLRRWKEEAMEILDVVDSCHDALPDGFKARLGESKVHAILGYIHGSQTT